jgi:oxygen-independent coproporphyrinogen-3 oxidase
MGYTSSKTQVMIGLGLSSISDSWYSFAQNEKTLEDYYARLEKNEIPVYRGHLLTEEDLVIRQHILNLMCCFSTSWHNEALYFPELPEVLAQLEEMQNDGLLKMTSKDIQVTEQGKAFVRNICMAFDLHLRRKIPNNRIFSMTI